MYRIRHQPWPKIIGRYKKLVEYRPMLELVEKIASADFAKNLFASTSMFQLKISYYPNFDPDGELLNIDFDFKTGDFKFEYQETPSPLYKRWGRVCRPPEAFGVLVRFLQLKKWFPFSDSRRGSPASR